MVTTVASPASREVWSAALERVSKRPSVVREIASMTEAVSQLAD